MLSIVPTSATVGTEQQAERKIHGVVRAVCAGCVKRCLRRARTKRPNFADARHIVEEITLLKTRVNGATPAAAAADPTE